MGGIETYFSSEMSKIKKNKIKPQELHNAMTYYSNLQRFDLTHRIVAATTTVLSLSYSDKQ